MFPPFVLERLAEVQRKQLLAKIAAGAAWDNEWGLVFTTALGQHLDDVTFHKHYKRIAAEAGVPDARIHDLRHSFATLTLAIGDDIRTVQSNLGHSTAAFTLQRYVHASENMKKESANRLQAFYQANIEKA